MNGVHLEAHSKGAWVGELWRGGRVFRRRYVHTSEPRMIAAVQDSIFSNEHRAARYVNYGNSIS